MLGFLSAQEARKKAVGCTECCGDLESPKKLPRGQEMECGFRDAACPPTPSVPPKDSLTGEPQPTADCISNKVTLRPPSEDSVQNHTATTRSAEKRLQGAS